MTPAGWTHLAFFGVILPSLVIRSRAKMLGPAGAALPDRVQHFRATTLQLCVLATGSLLVARVERMPLFPGALPSWRGILAGVMAYAVAVLCMRPRWRRAVQRNARVVHLFMPSTVRERAWWLAVSILAGLGEEVTWRGVQTGLLFVATGNYALAALLSALSFGGAHAVQGFKSAAVIVLFALGFQFLVWFTGSLYVAMAVHILYDITAGLTYGRIGRELGYGVEVVPGTA